MPQEIIQSLIIFTLLIVTPRIIITIVDKVLQNRTAHLQIQKYTLKEIVEDHRAVDIVQHALARKQRIKITCLAEWLKNRYID